MFRFQRKSSTEHSIGCKGVAFVELALIIPMLLILIVCVVDLGLALINYLNLVQVSYEGVRFASSLSDLETDANGPFVDLWTLDQAAAESAGKKAHWQVHKRLEELVISKSIYDFDLNALQIVTTYDGPNLTDPTPEDEQFTRKMVSVSIFGNYQGYFNWVLIPIRVELTAPYVRKFTSDSTCCPAWFPPANCNGLPPCT